MAPVSLLALSILIAFSADVAQAIPIRRPVTRDVRSSRPSGDLSAPDYNSFDTFNPNQFAENSPEWNMAMIKYLLDMKKNGHAIREVVAEEKSLPEMKEELAQMDVSVAENPIVCKMEPFNICYEVDEAGNMHPVGNRRPIRLLRVYRRRK